MAAAAASASASAAIAAGVAAGNINVAAPVAERATKALTAQLQAAQAHRVQAEHAAAESSVQLKAEIERMTADLTAATAAHESVYQDYRSTGT